MKKIILAPFRCLAGGVLGFAVFFILDRIIRFIVSLVFGIGIIRAVLTFPYGSAFLEDYLCLYIPAVCGALMATLFGKPAYYIFSAVLFALSVFTSILSYYANGFSLNFVPLIFFYGLALWRAHKNLEEK